LIFAIASAMRASKSGKDDRTVSHTAILQKRFLDHATNVLTRETRGFGNVVEKVDEPLARRPQRSYGHAFVQHSVARASVDPPE
jgi:hypothetical protein